MDNKLYSLFNRLTEDRKDSAKTLEKTSMRGLKDSVVEKYSDQAHFIYELIQNADDVGATKVRFLLYKDRLVFIHNGTRHFNITDVDTEEADTKTGKLGDINAITSIANSNKTAASIGKFGVGFKAVFQYTNEPRIYDPDISFKIQRFIVPVLINDVFNEKHPDETAFVFPFNHPTRTANEAFDDILSKLKRLVFPTLFLNNLQKISYRCLVNGMEGEYTKQIVDRYDSHSTSGEKIVLVNGSQSEKSTLWLFSKETIDGYKYSCGFFVDADENLVQTNHPAFCFFPTKKYTNLNFIINAPFLLTDSREGIRAGVRHNLRMIDLLSILAAESFVMLRDIGIKNGRRIISDNILDYIPINKSLYIPRDERDDVSLLPFYESIRDVFRDEMIWPSFTDYVKAVDGYIAFAAVYCDYFSNEQLASLCNDSSAKWIIPSISLETYYRARAGSGVDARYNYIVNEIGINSLRDTNLIDMISTSFMSKQEWDWIFKLYDFVLGTKDRIERSKVKPILFDQFDNPVAAYDDDGNAMLFIDDSASEGYSVVSPKLLRNDKALELIKRFDLHAPELKDKIFSKIIKKHELNEKTDFCALLDYYIQLLETDDEYDSAENTIQDLILPNIEDKEFIMCIDSNGERINAAPSDVIYYPTESLRMYFDGYSDVVFVNVEAYNTFLSAKQKKYFQEFMELIGVGMHVFVLEETLTEQVVNKICPKEKWDYSSRERKWINHKLDACEYVVKRIVDNKDKQLSLILWKELVNAYAERDYLNLVYHWFYRTSYQRKYPGTQAEMLRSSKWMFDVLGNMRSPEELSRINIDGAYSLDERGVEELMEFLQIKAADVDYSDLDDSIAKKLTEHDLYANLGIYDYPLEELERALQLLSQEKEKNNNLENTEKKLSPKMKVINEIKTRVKQHEENDGIEERSAPIEIKETDGDELMTASVDFTQRKEQMKEKFEEDIAQLARIEEAQNKALNSKRYSYAWFRALLLLETLANGNDNARSREVSINFSKAERDLSTNRTVVLKHPDKSIPMVMEQLVDIPLNITFRDGKTKRLIIDAANVQSYSLRVKVKQSDNLDDIDYESITNINISAQSPAFLTQSLLQEFSKFTESPYSFDDDYDMQMNLCENISFVFGPPGTGKTTYLANKTLIPLIRKNEAVRVLVLTPTNKAADVLVNKIIESSDDASYENWLVRYGITTDERIEDSPVFKGKEFEIDDYNKCVVVTTMARLPYDYFIDSKGNRNFLHGINWDYIVVDEASMIPLVYMVYLLYLKTPQRFIIAGDPFQIEPTTSVAEWKSENIYKMVHLDEFSSDAPTVPHKYHIKLLTTQYRSIPCVGEVFSKFAYKGVLEHYRTPESMRMLNIEDYLEYDNLNIISFPVSQYESIFKAKKLKSSNYQIYSALFAYEFVVYLSKAISKANPGEQFTIGIIAPYSAEAGLVDKLLAYADIPDAITVNSSTIHGFQGDECDIIVALFNPPPHISTNKEIFLNKQNVINVAISRARDYLFVLVPDDNTANVKDLVLLEKLKSIMRKEEVVELYSSEIEELLFDTPDYIEENAFSTGHQVVNVYGLPERRYEIRSEESALDVQVHGETNYKLNIEPDENTSASDIVTDSQHSSMPYALVNSVVEDAKYGVGKIVSIDARDIKVNFDGEIKTFTFPEYLLSSRLSVKDPMMRNRLNEFNKRFR